MPSSTLDILVNGALVGRLSSNGGAPAFAYEDSYRSSDDPTPLSLSLPLHRRAHTGSIVSHWLENLLPEDDRARRRIAQKFGERSTAPLVLLAHIGHDLAGAVQILPTGVDPSDDGDLIPWEKEKIAERIRLLHEDAASVSPESELGRWSLAGQQGKFALAKVGDQWMEPTGRTASTHIFKVGISGLTDSDLAEYATMRAAEALGLNTAHTRIERFDEEIAVVVERYDRRVLGGEIVRIHQEDFCQALGVGPTDKYQSDGGPGIASIAEVLADTSRPHEDLERLARWHAFQMVAACPDGHAKNLSMLLSGRAAILAPAYDLISGVFLLDGAAIRHKAKIAMKFGGEYRFGAIAETHILRAGGECRVDPERMLEIVGEQIADMEEAFAPALDDVASIRPRTAARMREAVARRAADLARRFGTPGR